MRISFDFMYKNNTIKKRLPAMMTLEAAVIVPVFFLIIYGSIGLSVDMYEVIEVSANKIEDNESIDAVKNFRHITIGEDLVSFVGGDSE